MKYFISFLLGSILCLTGCTTKTNLGYTSVIEVQEKNDIAVKVKAFEDQRSKGQQIGVLRNLYGMPIVKIVTDENIPNWIVNAFKLELTNAGYSIVDTDDNYLLEGKIIKAFAHTYFLYHGSMVVELSLKKDNNIIFQKTYKTNKGGGFNWIGSPAMCAKTLEYNLQRLCKHFIADVNQHLLDNSHGDLPNAPQQNNGI